VNDFIPKNESLIDIVRVVADKEKVINAIELLQKLKKKGYLVSLNVTGFSNYSHNERIELVHILKETCIDIIYIADTYGSLLPSDINRIFDLILENINNMQIGFHPHNNMQMALINSVEAIRLGINLIDTTIFGMGRGAGNLPLELLLAYFQRIIKTKYDIIPILIFLNQYMLPLHKKIGWGYSLSNLLSGLFKCHPYFIFDIIENYNFEIDEIVSILVKINKMNPPTYVPGMVDDIIGYKQI
ncbi:nucleoid-structuring protein H-NS, partial [Candidatus Magnetomorum sp. HK-1]